MVTESQVWEALELLYFAGRHIELYPEHGRVGRPTDFHRRISMGMSSEELLRRDDPSSVQRLVGMALEHYLNQQN